MKLLLFLLLILPCIAHANWNKQDIALESIFITLHTIDWGQTLDIENNNVYETNIFLGKHPSRKKINIFMGITLLLHIYLADKFKSNRLKMQLITISLKLYAVTNNAKLGLKINF